MVTHMPSPRPGSRPSGALWRPALAVVIGLLAAGCATGPAPSGSGGGVGGGTEPARKGDPYKVDGDWYHPLAAAQGYSEVGKASWYGGKFHGRPTASGEIFNKHRPTAAHRTLPLPTIARVTNLENGRSTQVRVNDRGPFVDTHERIIDLSYGAAKRLGMDKTGVARVKVEALRGPGPTEAREGEPGRTGGASDGLYLQVGAFQREGNAVRLKRRLRGMDLDRVVVSTVRRQGTRFFRVRIGPLPNVARADSLAQRLHRAGLPTGQLIRD
jgi:rare lipoprotein A